MLLADDAYHAERAGRYARLHASVFPSYCHGTRAAILKGSGKISAGSKQTRRLTIVLVESGSSSICKGPLFSASTLASGPSRGPLSSLVIVDSIIHDYTFLYTFLLAA